MTIILVTVAVLAIAVLLGLSGSPKGKAVSVKVDRDSTVRVERVGDEVTLKVEYVRAEERASDDELFPDIVNVPPPNDDESSCGGSFWQKVARLDALSREERMTIMNTLRFYGFIYEPDVSFRMRLDDGPEREDGGQEEPGGMEGDGIPVSASVADEAMEPVDDNDDPFRAPFRYWVRA